MPNYRTEDIRNITFVGHSGSGKTSLTEALLVKSGKIGEAGTQLFYMGSILFGKGVYIDNQFRTDSIQNEQLQYSPQNFKFNSQDFWGGYSFPIFKGKTERERTSNLIFSARSLYVRYKESPAVEYDRINFFSGESVFIIHIFLYRNIYKFKEYKL